VDEKVYKLFICPVCGEVSECNRNNCNDCIYSSPCAYRRSKTLKRVVGDLCGSCKLDKILKEQSAPKQKSKKNNKSSFPYNKPPKKKKKRRKK